MHFDRFWACRRLACDAVAKEIGCATGRGHSLLRILEQVFNRLPIGRGQVGKHHLAPALETGIGAAETGPPIFSICKRSTLSTFLGTQVVLGTSALKRGL